jgi:ABC-2 type transport system permease protein
VSRLVFRAMLLTFRRDRGALAMSLLLPVAVFLVFAAVFAGASGDELRVRVAVADEVGSEESQRLLRALGREPALQLTTGETLTAGEVRRRVRLGRADAGLVIRKEGRALSDLGGFGPAPLVILADPVRAVAAQVLAGQVQRAYFAALPDVALGGVGRILADGFVSLEPAQEEELSRELEALRVQTLAAEADGRPAQGQLESLLEREAAAGPGIGRSHVAYYAGAVAILFLLFSSVHGALSLLEERDSGLLDRLLAGPGGMGAVVAGKFLFLLAQGVFQVSVIFVVAWLLYGVDLPRHLPGFAVVTPAAAAAAAGLALALTTACATKRQAQTFANVTILIVSAVGGSMVPRFFMPPLLQSLGWLTPTTWALEAYTSVFWREEPLAALALPVALLTLAGFAGLATARVLSRRWERI